MNSKLFHIVYMTSCHETGKFYIGKHSTNDLNDGYQGSGTWVKRSLASGKALTTELIGSYGTEDEAYEAEKEFIAAFKFDCPDKIMNFQDGGEGWTKGKPFSDETKAKMSLVRKGKSRPKEHTAPMIAAAAKKKRELGLSVEWKEKIAASTKKSLNYRRKWIVCLRTGMVFHGADMAAEFWGISNKAVSAICRGDQKSKTHKFEYMD